MAFNLTGEEFEAIKEAYLSIDTNRDGIISEEELVNAALDQVKGCTEEDIEAIKLMCDLEKDGTMTFCEFLEMMAEFEYNKDQSELGLKAMFKAFDRNGDGILSKDEIKRAWKMFINPDEESAEREVNECIDRCDINGDGYISYDEFVQGILNNNIPQTKDGNVSFV